MRSEPARYLKRYVPTAKFRQKNILSEIPWETVMIEIGSLLISGLCTKSTFFHEQF